MNDFVNGDSVARTRMLTQLTSGVILGTAMGSGVATVGRLGFFKTPGAKGLTELKKLPSPREFLLSKVEHPKLTRIVDQLYRPTAKYGSGSTADAVRHELQTGELLSKTGHIQKAVESRNALSDLINSGKLNYEDERIAMSIRKNLQNALTEKPWDKVYIGRQTL